MALALAACGGSTEQFEPFVPQRLVSFGDEASALGDGTTAPLGYNWSVNGLDTQSNFDCRLLPIWTQSLAAIYGFVYRECNPNNIAEPQARTWAVAGAKVRDVQAQIDAQVQAGGIRAKDLATLFIGTNDVFELYAQFPQRSEDDLVAEARARGKQAALLVNQLIDMDAKVIVSNLPDLGLTPYARNENVVHTDTDRVTVIRHLTYAFNEQLGVNILLDGRYVGLVQIDQRTQAIGRDPASYGFANAWLGACAVALPNCTTATLATNASATLWLWADDRWFSPGGHTQLSTMAIDRARRNPF